MAGDGPVEQGMRERGLIRLVVAMPAEAVHVDEHVALPPHAEVERELRDHAHGLGIVAIHVEDGRLDHLRHVGAVARRARVAGVRREPDLVVDHEVDRAAGPVPGQLGEIQGLGHDALAREGRVAVDQQREHAPPLLGVAADALARAHLALDDRVDDLEVGRVCREPDLDLLPGGRGERRLVSKMVFHVPVAPDRVGDVVLGELLKQLVE